MSPTGEFRLSLPTPPGVEHGAPAAILHCDDEVFLMAEDEVWRGQLLVELRGIRADVSRLETQIEKGESRRELDAKEAFERLRKAEIDIALQQQALQNQGKQLKRDISLLAAILGTVGGAIATAIVNVALR